MKTCNEYKLTMLDNGRLPHRLVAELRFVEDEFRKAWPDLKRDPIGFGLIEAGRGVVFVKRLLLAPNVSVGILTAFLIVVSIVLTIRVLEKAGGSSTHAAAANEDILTSDIVTLDLSRTSRSDLGVGLRGKGRVGFERDKGEGSNAQPKHARGGGTGGLHDPVELQNGKLPQPSLIAAAIPKLSPINKPNLPAAGIDIDPALWQDLKAPVFGDPRSNSRVASNGPGDGGGVGTQQGTGIGNGKGPGFGPGENGNTGGGSREIGGGLRGGSSGNNPDDRERVLRVSEVEQRARLLSKPEPQYTEEARRNQATGTVVLRVVFSSTGDVQEIRAVQTLPFGLTEKAIAAARQIRFLPATSGGRPVSVYMQLEYNFNLY